MVAYALALTVRLMQPATKQSRWLARSIVATATALGSWTVVLPILDDPGAAYAMRIVHIMIWALSLGVYVAFLGTLDSKLSRWAGGPIGRTAITVATLAGMAWPIVWSGAFITRVFEPPGPHALFPGADNGWANGLIALEALTVIIWTFGLVVAYSTYRTARGTGARAQGRAYLIAFGWRDVALIVTFLFVVFQLAELFLPFWADALSYREPLVYKLNLVMFPVEQLVFYALLSYGLFKARLFDLDLKVKAGLARGILAAIILGSFLVVSQLVENAASDTLGLISGSVVAGIGLLAIRPLMRFADKVADRAMPRVSENEAYLSSRKEMVYRGAVESALFDGTVGSKDRRLLLRLQVDLGLDAKRANQLELAVLDELS